MPGPLTGGALIVEAWKPRTRLEAAIRCIMDSGRAGCLDRTAITRLVSESDHGKITELELDLAIWRLLCWWGEKDALPVDEVEPPWLQDSMREGSLGRMRWMLVKRLLTRIVWPWSRPMIKL